jgi:hypothetical protein
MTDDTTIKSLFDHAKKEPTGPGEFPNQPTVFATFVEHFSNIHPPGSEETADSVNYANGPLKLSQNKLTLTGEFRLWRNIYTPEMPNFSGGPPTPEDAFDDKSEKGTVVISVSNTGKVTSQRKVSGKPIGGMPPQAWAATYQDGLFIEKSTGSVKSLSFTFGEVPA